MYDRILVPLDGSKRAEAILPHVQKIAQDGNSQVILLNVLEHKVPLGESFGPTRIQRQEIITDEEEQQKAAEVYLEDLAAELRRMDIRTQCKVQFGPVVRVIGEIAEEEDASLIAIASHGRSGLARVFYGSVAAGVLQSIDRPLLVIRSRNM